MKRSEYKRMSATAQGRKELHEILLSEIREKMDNLVNSAPIENQSSCKKITDKVFDNIKNHGNSVLFDFFADDELSQSNFLHYISKYYGTN